MGAAGDERFLRAQEIVQGDDPGGFVARLEDGESTRSIDQQARHFADGEAAAAGRHFLENGRAPFVDR